MKFPTITLALYIGFAGADEGATAWAIDRRPELRRAEVGLPGPVRIPVKVGVTGANTYIDARLLRNRRKTRRVFRVLAVGMQVAATVIAVKRGSEH